VKAAYQGVRGAYSELALKNHFGPKCEAVGFAFSEQVFEAVRDGRVDAGFVPVENSIVGSVGVNTDLLLKEHVFAVAEAYLKIEHCLLGLPSAKLKNIKTVYSHPIALAQCRDFLTQRGLKAVPEYDTAGSAQIVAQRQKPEEAAIASSQCAEAYGLKVLQAEIQSVPNNFTRFLAFVRKAEVPKDLKMEKTSVAFATKHHPGALLNCLKRFADHKVNLTKLESRPIPENPFAYVFFTDFIGGMNEPAVAGALKELEHDAATVKILGSYPIARRA
jgi:prephenate dehydratase